MLQNSYQTDLAVTQVAMNWNYPLILLYYSTIVVLLQVLMLRSLLVFPLPLLPLVEYHCCYCELTQKPGDIQRYLYCCCHSNHSAFLMFHHRQVVQLVRDPRGILASRIETFRDTYRLWRLWRATGRRPHNLDLGQINTVCEDFLRSVSTGLARPAWLRGRYILLRWEGQG